MKAGVYYSNKDLRVIETEYPKIACNEMIVKVMASGICGSDLLEWYRIDRVPLILGHEVSGEVVDVGMGVTKYHPGDRVCVAHHVPCGRCHYCISGHHTVCNTLLHTNFDPGGFCEFIRLPSINIERGTFLLPDDVGFEEATFVEPLACVVRAQNKLGDLSGKTILVIGSGIAGLLHIQVAKLKGAGRIIATDINKFRCGQAKRYGADFTLSGSEDITSGIRELNEGMLADVVILCTGAMEALKQAMRSIERGGILLFFAVTDKGSSIPFNPNDLLWRTEITITSSYAGSQEDYAKALDLIHLKKINVQDMITHRFSLDDIADAFKIAQEVSDALKVIIKPHGL